MRALAGNSERYKALAAYFALLSGSVLLLAFLSSHVATQAITVALPYFPDRGPRTLSLVERRQIEAAQPITLVASSAPAPTPLPSTPAGKLAAQMDRAEEFELGGSRLERRPVRRSGRRDEPRVALSAGEEFGRRFGVLTVASR